LKLSYCLTSQQQLCDYYFMSVCESEMEPGQDFWPVTRPDLTWSGGWAL